MYRKSLGSIETEIKINDAQFKIIACTAVLPDMPIIDEIPFMKKLNLLHPKWKEKQNTVMNEWINEYWDKPNFAHAYYFSIWNFLFQPNKVYSTSYMTRQLEAVIIEVSMV